MLVGEIIINAIKSMVVDSDNHYFIKFDVH